MDDYGMQGRGPSRSGPAADETQDPAVLTNRTALIALGVALVSWLPFGALSPAAIALGLRAWREMKASHEQGGTAAYFAVLIGLAGLGLWGWLFFRIDLSCIGVARGWIAAAYGVVALGATLGLLAGAGSWSTWIWSLIILGVAVGGGLAAFAFWFAAAMAECF